MKHSISFYDVIVVGAGMGGLTTAALLANDGLRVLILEAAHVTGGCSSSFKRKGYVFESGATTLTGFAESELIVSYPATPVTWEKWIHRSKGRVGGLPQSMERSILDWPDAATHVDGLWMCGDTVYPGQGIPGVTLSGINVYYRIKQHLSRQRSISFV